MFSKHIFEFIQDVQWNDIDYMNNRNGFTIDPVNYADLGSFVEQLHKDGRHYVLIVVSRSRRRTRKSAKNAATFS